jgi:hypothetical protein
MRSLLVVAAVIAAALAVSFLSVAAHDDGTLVPPPVAVTEGFLRALARHRYPQALALLDQDLRDVATLRAWQEAMESRYGTVRDVHAEYGPRSGDRAVATARLTTRSGEVALALELVRQGADWRIAALPAAATPP